MKILKRFGFKFPPCLTPIFGSNVDDILSFSRTCKMVFKYICIRILFSLFELMLYVAVNSNGHVGTLPPFYGTFT